MYGRRVQLCLLLAIFLVYIRLLCPSVYWGEGPLLTLCGSFLGISHPPGYPLFILLSRCLHFAPLGDAAYRMNLFSAISVLAACGAAFGIGARLRMPGWARIVFVLLLSLGPLVVKAATMAEVYGLNLALVCACLMFSCTGGLRSLFLVSFLMGLALGNHLTIILLAPSLVILLHPAARAAVRSGVNAYVLAACFFLAGLSVVIYDPLRSISGAPVRWDQPDRWSRLLVLLSASDEAVPSLTSGDRRPIETFTAVMLPSVTVRQAGWAGTLLAVWGLASGMIRRPRVFAALLAAFLCYMVPVSMYKTNEAEYFAIPAVIFVITCAVWGLIRFDSAVRKRLPRTAGRIVTALVAVYLVSGRLTALPSLDRSECWLPLDFAQFLSQGVEDGALVITERSDISFLLWYLQGVERRLVYSPVLFKHLFSFSWYPRQVVELYPSVRFPAAPDDYFEDSREWSTTYTAGVVKLNIDRCPVYTVDRHVMEAEILPVTGGRLAPSGLMFRIREEGDSRPPSVSRLSMLRLAGADNVSLLQVAAQVEALAEAAETCGYRGLSDRLRAFNMTVYENLRL